MNEYDDDQKKIKTNQISADPFSNRAVQRLERKKKKSKSVYDIRDILTDQKKVSLSLAQMSAISALKLSLLGGWFRWVLYYRLSP